MSDHWNTAYGKGAETRSWFQPEATESLEFIAKAGATPSDAVIDVGGGASVLVDDLLARGFGDLTVLDLSDEGMAIARARLGARGDGVTWIVADLLAWTPPRSYGGWHDRAVLHFLTADHERRRYAEVAGAAVRPGGWIAVGGFAPDGPTSCSGLPVRGASSDELAELFADAFTPVTTGRVVHTTPSGNDQAFAWLVARRRAPHPTG